MEKENCPSEVPALSHQILDQEAAKISLLIQAVQQKSATGEQSQVASELFAWAEAFEAEGKRAEAEFLYLHAINLWEKTFGVDYPIIFTSLRDYAKLLLERSTQQPAEIFTQRELMPVAELDLSA